MTGGLRVLSLFSGVGGFDLGLERAGYETVFQCEIDKHATKVLERHWPGVPRWGDITTLTGRHIVDTVGAIDVVAWGSPCQDLSVAGKRAGLGGQRSGLFYEGMRIIKEIKEATDGRYPRISLWENVLGALNSNRGADFGCVINEMAEAGALVIEWRVLDAQYFGIPQRRRRVFVVAVFDSSTAERCPDPLLPVSESVPRDTQESATARQTSASKIAAGFGSGNYGGWTETEIAVTLSQRDYKSSNTVTVVEPPILIDRAAFNQGQNALYEPIISDAPVTPSLVARGPHAVSTSTTTDIVGPLTTYMSSPRGTETTDSNFAIVTPFMTVRRLTPLECERLMGWPDGWTGEQHDGHRYRQCGNGVASPVATWLGEQLRKVLVEG